MIPYFAERMDCWYEFTGSTNLTPIYPEFPFVFIPRTLHVALKPASPTSLLSGKKSPLKLGCG